MPNNAQFFANNASTTLGSNVDGVATSISVSSAAGFPTSSPFTILIDAELMLVTSGAGTTTWGVTRGAEGTAAAPHTALATITQMWTLAGLQSLGQGFWPTLQPGGLTGAIQPTRYAGATASGAPGSGTFSAGDFVIDQKGRVWVCYTAGAPGSWYGLGFGGNAWILRQSNNLTVPTGTNTTIPFNASDSNPASLTVSGGIVTIAVAGWYQVNADWQLPNVTSNAAQFQSVNLATTGPGILGAGVAGVIPFTAFGQVNLNGLVYFPAGSTVGVQAKQNSSGSITCNLAHFSGVLVG